MTALSADELIAWVERTSDGWRERIGTHPEILSLQCDVRETSNVAQLLQHIVAVELRYAERLQGLPQTPYEQVAYGSADEIYATHERAMALLRSQLASAQVDWEQTIEFATRSAGTLRASRRTVLVHLLMHSIRHYAQLATLVRKAGIKPGWDMDYLLMGAVQA